MPNGYMIINGYFISSTLRRVDLIKSVSNICPSVHPSVRTYVRTYVRRTTYKKVYSISIKFGLWVEVGE